MISSAEGTGRAGISPADLMAKNAQPIGACPKRMCDPANRSEKNAKPISMAGVSKGFAEIMLALPKVLWNLLGPGPRRLWMDVLGTNNVHCHLTMLSLCVLAANSAVLFSRYDG